LDLLACCSSPSISLRASDSISICAWESGLSPIMKSPTRYRIIHNTLHEALTPCRSAIGLGRRSLSWNYLRSLRQTTNSSRHNAWSLHRRGAVESASRFSRGILQHARHLATVSNGTNQFSLDPWPWVCSTGANSSFSQP